ncbi:MAG: PilT/PilU family type 4a pilus ATPase [Oscillospiraceae bacterium]|jgi:twitching motility protein PilT|nr:PilT/PilU family type 4a pilus ATPase [Oscillospiraceae bacterium]
MDTLEEILKSAVEYGATDIFILAGTTVAFKRDGEIVPQPGNMILPPSAKVLIERIYEIAKRDMEHFLETGDDDFSFALPGMSRFRASVYKQRGSYAATIRIILFGIPDYRTLGIPEQVVKSVDRGSGLILVTGQAGSGKSTTLACMIEYINTTRHGHIITIEDPIEYLYQNKKAIISQREVDIDTESYLNALRACLRQAPDVILVGEMRDLETIQTVMTAAETGHLVISTLHTVGAAGTVGRIIDVFPPAQQPQILVQLSMLLQAVVSQQLVPTIDGGQTPAFEIMYNTTAVRTMIRESKVHQLDSVIASGAADGMMSMDANLLAMFQEGKITEKTALLKCFNQDMMQKRINASKR